MKIFPIDAVFGHRIAYKFEGDAILHGAANNLTLVRNPFDGRTMIMVVDRAGKLTYTMDLRKDTKMDEAVILIKELHEVVQEQGEWMNSNIVADVIKRKRCGMIGARWKRVWLEDQKRLVGFGVDDGPIRAARCAELEEEV